MSAVDVEDDVVSLASIGRRPKREIRKEKAKKREERVDRTLCVKLRKRVDKSTLEAVLSNAHSGVQSVFLPRQKFPKFAFVLCKEEKIRNEVSKALKEIEDEKVGSLHVSNGKPKPKVIYTPKEVQRKSVDPLTLMLEMIPKELSTEAIQAEFPKCKKVSRFNPRRAYVYFKTAEDGMEAFQKLEKNQLCGHKVRPKFRKVNCKKALKHRKDSTNSKSKETEDTKDSANESDEENASDLSDVQNDSNSADVGSDSE